MLPILVTVVCLLALKGQKSPEKVYEPSRKVWLPLWTPPVSEPMYKNNFDQPLSTTQYQATMLKPPLFDIPKLSIPELFLLRYVKQPHLTNVYQKQFDTGLWQICALNSSRGNIYLSLLLSDPVTPAPNAEVLISYDDAAVEQLINRTTGTQLGLFGRVVFHNHKTIPNEELLKFFLGDAKYPYSIGHHLL